MPWTRLGNWLDWLRGPARTADPRDVLARAGEAAAARYLEARGHRIVARRLRTPFGEVDLVCEIDDTVVVVEVKTRRSGAFARPAEAVDRSKARRLRRSALYLLERRHRGARRYRIDVVEVLWREDSEPELVHLEDAVDRGEEA